MPYVSIYWLNTYTRKDPRTIKKRIQDLPKNSKGKFDSAEALEKIYCGSFTKLDGEFVSTAEAVRRLTIAKEKEIELNMQIKRGTRIPKEDVDRAWQTVCRSMAGIIKANRGRVLTYETINEIFDTMRSEAARLNREHGNGSDFVGDAV